MGRPSGRPICFVSPKCDIHLRTAADAKLPSEGGDTFFVTRQQPRSRSVRRFLSSRALRVPMAVLAGLSASLPLAALTPGAGSAGVITSQAACAVNSPNGTWSPYDDMTNAGDPYSM